MRRRLVDSYTDPATNIKYGLRGDPLDFALGQQYTHEHVMAATRDFLTKNALAPLVNGFDRTLAGGLSLSIAAGAVYDVAGVLHETITAPAGQPAVVTLEASDPANPRVDLVYVLLEAGVQVLPIPRTFRRTLTEAEINSRQQPYLPENFTRFSEEHARATVRVRKGTPAANPVAPAVQAGEAPLFEVRVNAGAVTLVAGNITDRRNKTRSLADAWLGIDALNANPILTNFTEQVQDALLTFFPDASPFDWTVDDAGNRVSLDIATATAGLKGLMSAADKAKSDAATSAATADTLVKRDNLGAASLSALSTTGHSKMGAAAGVRATFLTVEDAGTTTPQATLYKSNANFTKPVVLRLVANCNDATGGEESGVLDVQDWNPGAPGATASGMHNLMTLRGTNTQGPATAFRVRSIGDGFLSRDLSVGRNATVLGAFTAASKNFHIDHPLDPENKDLIHAAVESNKHPLMYWFEVELDDGSAAPFPGIDLDAKLGFTAGTCKALMQNIMVICVRHPAGLNVTDTIFVGEDPVQAVSLQLTSQAGDNSTVRVLLLAERADPYIMAAPFVDVSGRLVPEQLKPVPTPAELALLDPLTIGVDAGNPLEGLTLDQEVSSLRGKQGFPRHPEVVDGGGPTPMRSVTYALTTETEGPNYPAAAVTNDAAGTVAWSNPGNVGDEDGLYAVAAAQGNLLSHFLKATAFGAAMPEGATVRGFVVEIRMRNPNHSNALASVARVSLVKGGAITAQNRAADAGADIPEVSAVKTYGSPSQLWGETWTPAEVNAADFGVAFAATLDPTSEMFTDALAEVEFIRVTAHYTED